MQLFLSRPLLLERFSVSVSLLPNDVRQALAISRLNSPVQILYVPVLANGSLCGDAGEAQKLADEQMRRYPNATLLTCILRAYHPRGNCAAT